MIAPRHVATLRDVAVRAGVHPATASRALDPVRYTRVSAGVRRRVEDAARELGYTRDLVAQNLRRGRTGFVGVIVADLGNPYIAPVIRGLGEELEPKGFVLFIAESLDDGARFQRLLKQMRSRRVDALVTTAARTTDLAAVCEAVDEGLRIVLASRAIPGAQLPTVVHDGVMAGRLAAEHLISRGCHRLGEIIGSSTIQPYADRDRGFRAAAALCPDVVVVTTPGTADADTIDEGRRLARILIENEGVDGIFAHDDVMAIGAIDAIKLSGRKCPDDVAVIGHDDVPLADRLEPSLTTVRTNGKELGRLAGLAVLRLLENLGDAPFTWSLAPELVERESTRRGDK